jgi:hypothetical protein
MTSTARTTQTPPCGAEARRAPNRIVDAQRRLYDAEVALHIAHTSHVDEWITAAADRLHEALVAYETAAATPTVTPS